VPYTPSRGQAYWVTIEGMRKPWLIVSNNARHAQLGNALAVRLTTTAKPVLASVVRLDHRDKPLAGSVLCDDVAIIWHDELEELAGALTMQTMMRVDNGLRAALALN
jgi:mRNA interferase MazF